MTPRVVGVRIRHVPNRPLAWGLFVDTYIAGKHVCGARFFATEAEAEAQYPVAAADVTRRREEAEADGRLKKALTLPPLPKAPKGVILFETLVERWLDEHVKEMCAAGTYRVYKSVLDNHLLKIMRTWPVHDDTLTRERIRLLLKEQLFRAGVTLPTRLTCQATLSACFSWAMHMLPPRTLTVNPANGLGRFLRDKSEKAVQLKQPPNPMTRVQVEAFLERVKAVTPDLYEWFLWGADAGSRVGEVSALKWSALDLDRGKAHIIQSFSAAHRWLARQDGEEGKAIGEKDTKTHRTDQWIDLSPRVVEAMRALRTRTREAWFARGRHGVEPVHCFLTRDLTPRRPDKVVYAAFRQACEALDLKGQTGAPFTIHCLRDTFATLAILDGKDIGWVALQLGHADEMTTRKHYYKWMRLVDPNVLDPHAREQR